MGPAPSPLHPLGLISSTVGDDPQLVLRGEGAALRPRCRVGPGRFGAGHKGVILLSCPLRLTRQSGMSRPRLTERDLGKAVPYRIYDVVANTGWVNVGTDHDTAAFAVENGRRWHGQGRDAYPQAGRLLITADAGGSNGYRTRAWKLELAQLAAETGLTITVCHPPPGTSKGSGSRRESHPPAPTDPYVNLSVYTAASSGACGLHLICTLQGLPSLSPRPGPRPTSERPCWTCG
jgi:hypothetical protein